MSKDHDSGFEPLSDEDVEAIVNGEKQAPHGRRHLSLEQALSYLQEQLARLQSESKPWETIEVTQPVRDKKGNFVVEDGFVKTETKKVQKWAVLAGPIIERQNVLKDEYRKHLRTYPGPLTAERRHRELADVVNQEFGGAANADNRGARADFERKYREERGWA